MHVTCANEQTRKIDLLVQTIRKPYLDESFSFEVNQKRLCGTMTHNNIGRCKYGFLVCKENVVLRRWERSKQKFCFIKPELIKVDLPP